MIQYGFKGMVLIKFSEKHCYVEYYMVSLISEVDHWLKATPVLHSDSSCLEIHEVRIGAGYSAVARRPGRAGARLSIAKHVGCRQPASWLLRFSCRFWCFGSYANVCYVLLSGRDFCSRGEALYYLT